MVGPRRPGKCTRVLASFKLLSRNRRKVRPDQKKKKYSGFYSCGFLSLYGVLKPHNASLLFLRIPILHIVFPFFGKDRGGRDSDWVHAASNLTGCNKSNVIRTCGRLCLPWKHCMCAEKGLLNHISRSSAQCSRASLLSDDLHCNKGDVSMKP